MTEQLATKQCDELATRCPLFGVGTKQHAQHKTFLFGTHGFILFVDGDVRESRLWGDPKPLADVRDYIHDRMGTYEIA